MSIVSAPNGMVIIDDLTAAPNGPGIVKQLADQVDEFYGKSYANAAALPASGKFPGQRVWLVDVKGWGVWNGSAWITDTAWQTTGFTLGSGWTLGTAGLAVKRANGDAYLQVEVNKGSFSAGETAFTIPAGFRLAPQPSGVTSGWRVLASNATTTATLAQINTSGTVTPVTSGSGGLIFSAVYPSA